MNGLPHKDKIVLNMPLNGALYNNEKILDRSGKGHHGTIVGTEQYTKNDLGKQSFDFDGSTYISCGNNTDISIDNDKTFVMMFSIKPISGSRFITNSIDSNNNGFAVSYTTSSADEATLYFRSVTNGSTRYSTCSMSLRYDCTSIITIIYDNGNISFYINGVFSNSFTGKSFGGMIETPFWIAPDYATMSLLNDTMNDFIIWSGTTLTESEVQQVVKYINNPPNYSVPSKPAITSDGVNDYIDTGVIPTENTKVELLGSFNDMSNDNMIGQITTDAYYYFGRTSLDNWRIGFGDSYVTTPEHADNNIHKFVCESGKLTIDDVEVLDTNYELYSTASTPFYLYGRSNTSTYSNLTCFYCKIWKGGELVRHFVPQSNGTMIDLVHGVEYGNQGTGDLIYSNEPYELSDTSKILSLRGGDRDLTGKRNWNYNNTIFGKNIVGNGIDTRVGYDVINFDSDNPNFTISTIVNTPLVESVVRPIVANGNNANTSTNNQYYLDIYYGKIRWKIGNMSLIIEDVIRVNKNNHITLISDNYTGYLYLNGLLIDTQEFSLYADQTSSFCFNIASRQTTTNTWNAWFNGTIHKFEVFNEAKSAEWVKQDYLKESRYF